MRPLFKTLSVLSLLTLTASPAFAAGKTVTLQTLGKANAPITVDEFVSLTCGHCAHFYTTILPEIEKNYIATGKVKFILHDFPMDGIALKAAALAHCMPTEQYYPFINVLYKNQLAWAGAPKPEQVLIQYAKLGGLPEAEAKACMDDQDLQNAIVAERTDAENNFHIQATPTFIINNGAERVEGTEPAEAFAKTFDGLLTKKQK